MLMMANNYIVLKFIITPWSLQVAEIDLQKNTMCEWLGISLEGEPPLVHYSERIDMVGWYLQKI